MQEAPPLRFRIVLQVSFPDADRYHQCDYGEHLNAVLDAIRNAPNIKCTDVVMRAASTIGPSEENQDWNAPPTFDFGILTPAAGAVFGLGVEPIPPVDARHVASVWNVLSMAERGGLQQNVNIAIGQALGPDVNANAVLARAYILRLLQRAGHLPSEASDQLFTKAAAIPLSNAPRELSDLTKYSALFE